jgi:aryl-alcohol dehydrogenase-like predicted oxidoreductase
LPADSRAMLPGYEWLRKDFESPEGQAKLAKVKALASVADDAGLPIHHLALLWCLANPRVSTVILGASRLDQLTNNLAALDARARLTPDVLEAVEQVMQTRPEGPRRF